MIIKAPSLVLPLAREWIEIKRLELKCPIHNVLPLAREWIEIPNGKTPKDIDDVLPLAREWIEISRAMFRMK